MRRKTNIRLLVLGSVPHDLNLSALTKYSSSVFEITEPIETYAIRSGSDGSNWEFTDRNISHNIPSNENEDMTIALTNVPLEDNWYSRRLQNNTVIFTFQEISDYLRFNNIPLENVVYRLLYEYSLVYRENNGNIPSCDQYTEFTHDETKGCIYDMNGLKSDIIYSCDSPIICETCSQRLERNGVSREAVSDSKKELKKVRKPLFYRLSAWVSRHPIWSIAIASTWSIFIGTISSLIANQFSN
ncbi:hypothetical protein PCO86_02520 [Pectobacteriaceae bacterium CE70]|nr:hypothetical protein PCO86_02520 [Pectobacteriaceae bacterium CE70]WJY11332.1 hypothetical protein PCO80_02525 [Pectobacteriaceae bacterium C80]